MAGKDIRLLTRFYTAVFGWEVTQQGPGYAQVATPNLRGAMVEAPESTLTLGVIVSDLPAALAKAEAEGGTVVMPTTDNGWVRKGQVRDPAGNLLTLIQK